ncbi:MAG: isochorismatase family protein [Acidimicrobiia bacterium]|nr:isochorismatase family protein [Acidimicrobiia bacterium]NNF62736.1 isochorismatase family protein [Acidimicrobiia bacterium]
MDYSPTTALIVVDMQNDFADSEGSLSVAGGGALLPVVNNEIAAASGANAVVVYTQDWHPPSTPHFAKDGGIWPVHCVMDTWGAEFHPELNVVGQVVRKGTRGEDGYSGFTMQDPETGEKLPTELADLLRSAGVDRIVVTGLALDYCVKATALDGAALGFSTSVLRRATAAVNLQPDDGTAAVAELVDAGVTVH